MLHTIRLHGLDMRRTIPSVGEEAGLLTSEGTCAGAFGVDGHGEQAHGDAFACGHQHIHLALGRVGIDTQRLIDEIVGGIAHGRNDHCNGIALFLRLHNTAGDALDGFGVGHGGAAVFLHDESHCCPILCLERFQTRVS